jgi:putative tricarboxylic transport membrane protein
VAAPDDAPKEQHPVAAVILLVLGIAVAIGSLTYGWGSLESPGAGFVPLLSGVAIAGFSAITLVATLTRGWHPLRELFAGVRWQQPMIATGCLLLYAIFLQELGFLIATVLLMGYLYRILQPSSWMETLLVSLATAVGFYLVFQKWLDVQLPRGLLAF